MQIDRLFEIVYILLNKKKVTAKELADKFEVSVRTVYRDVDTLSACGIPVYTLHGRGGGIALMEGFVLNSGVISKEEQSQILFALKSMSATKFIDSSGIISKLSGVFEKSDNDWLEVDFSRWGFAEEDKIKFDMLKGAILSKRYIEFTYFSSHGEVTERRVKPLKLVFKQKEWYIQGFCMAREALRTFKTNRIYSLEVSEEEFSDKFENLPLVDNIFCGHGEFPIIKLKFNQAVAYRVFDEFSYGHIEKCDDGGFMVKANMPFDEWTFNYILSFGANVEVIEPERIKWLIIRETKKIQSLYTDSGLKKVD